MRGRHFQEAPTPGDSMGDPPEKFPVPHVGRFRITGDQERHEGRDAQTNAYIAPFGSAYPDASPVGDGLARRVGH
ncbi:hypothetical protein [Rhizosaccharibacter radicis]|uniref:Uncharacterized protein n=1 Tax=Rhizosaccharibacter radicis TaxID=2782605 RepID=A0ABT1VXU5_9PROT|nr:hypothetical protein [Acetobacteraceae bacterium KSS12]